jgi:CRISPR/Cas system-associated exonuclease Cas4 (RecB family)
MATYVSPSQLDTYLTCKRKWGFRYLDGIEAPPHRSAKVGTRVHEILETWLRDATPPVIDEKMVIDNHEYFPGRIAMEAIPFLPPPGPHLTLEQEFRNKHWLGYKDVRYRAAENHVVVMDHKTTSDLGWAKTPEDLAIDPQAIIYAKSEFDADPRVQIVDLAWTYMKTSKPYKARPVRLRVLREYVDEAIRPYSLQHPS